METGTIYKVVGFNNETIYAKIVDSWGGFIFDVCQCNEQGELLPNGSRANGRTRGEIENLIQQGFWTLHKA